MGQRASHFDRGKDHGGAGCRVACLRSAAVLLSLWTSDVLGWLVLLAPLSILVLLPIFVLSLSQRISAVMIGRLPGKWLRLAVAKLHASYSSFCGRRLALGQNYLLVLLEQSAQVAILYISARSVGIAAPVMSLIAVLLLSEFLRKVTMVLDGWGLAQVAVVATCSLAGIDRTLALGMGLLSYAAEIVVTAPAFYFFLAPSSASRSLSEAS